MGFLQGDGEEHNKGITFALFLLSSTEIVHSKMEYQETSSLLQQKLQNKYYVDPPKACHVDVAVQMPFRFSLKIYAIGFHWDTRAIYSYLSLLSNGSIFAASARQQGLERNTPATSEPHVVFCMHGT